MIAKPGASGPMPVMFVGHGSPMNAIEENRWSEAFRALRVGLPPAKAILVVSAHWYIGGTLLTGNSEPKTIHDFSGFPPALYEVQYPAKGSPDVAKRVRSLIGEERASLDSSWGLDHGTWSVLRWIFPDAEVPVVQLSIDRQLAAKQHLEIGRSLRELRDEGILIVASGNITHNLRDAFGRMRENRRDTPDWAREFDNTVAKATPEHDIETLLGVLSTETGRMAHPTPEHWLPFLYALGASDENDEVRYSSEAFDWGSLSMRNIVWG